MKKSIIKTLVLSAIAAFGLTACNDAWEDHYKEDPQLNSKETLWDIIAKRSDLSEFRAMLTRTGYDELLKQNRYYTVWAPKDGTFTYEEVNDSLLQVEFVENHIADFRHEASGKMEENMVKMINEKYIYFDGKGNDYTFKSKKLLEKNIKAKNGTLHVIDGYANFTANIWEQLAKVDSLSEINSFLKSFNLDYFDEVNSVQGPIVNGQITYLDSVIIHQNPWFSKIGYLAKEDSSYYMIAPTNKAWREMKEKALTYFVYPSTKVGADSLQRLNALSAMCNHLVFSRAYNNLKLTEDPQAQDSLYSNYWGGRKKFRFEEYKNLYNNLVSKEELSNGTLYVTDTYNFDPIKCWHDTIRIEGEDAFNITVGSCTQEMVSIPRDSIITYKKMSRGMYGEFVPTASTANPKLTINIPKVLSAPYLVKCVFVPANIVNKRVTTLQPNKYTVQLKYKDLNGKVQTLAMGTKLVNFNNGYEQMDTITFYPNDDAKTPFFHFPVNEFDLSGTEEASTQLIITSALTSREKDFDRTFRIDCIILEPINEETYVIPEDEENEGTDNE